MTTDRILDALDRDLNRATKLLGDCARRIRRTELSHSENRRLIGQALAKILQIQLQIYERRPDLTPEHLTKEWNDPPQKESDADDLGAAL
jgi:hypothetical protein